MADTRQINDRNAGAIAAEGTIGGLASRSDAPTPLHLIELAGGSPHLDLQDLRVGYGKMEVVHGLDLKVGRGQSVCLVGPNGAGKSTVLNAIFGLADVFGGHIQVAGRDVVGVSARTMLTKAKVAYVLQTSSVFPDMTVEENLLMGGYLLPSWRQAAEAAERIFDTYPKLDERRGECAGALSGGERRILELSRALITGPDILLVDEPSIGLEPRAIEAVFDMLDRLQQVDGKTVVIVEQNVKKGLEFADVGYVLVAGRVALADRAERLLKNPQVARFFLGG
jgi:branched-chain amino acid transport system ATP-binding protein